MKTYSILLILFFFTSSLIAQEEYSFKDPDLQSFYKQIALRYGNTDPRMVIRKWDSDIKIYTEPSVTTGMKDGIQKIMDEVNPLLGKIKIGWVNEKGLANFIVKSDTSQKTGPYMQWDAAQIMYKGVINIDPNVIFNTAEQNGKTRQSLLLILGHFSFKDIDKKQSKFLKCNLASWKNDINSLDKAIIKFHYSDDIKVGMDEKDLDSYFKKLKK